MLKTIFVPEVCSAHAEVIPAGGSSLEGQASLLRTRGGDPESSGLSTLFSQSAPHTRR